VDAGAAGAVDVELTVDGDGVAAVGRHPGRQAGVVVHLQLVTLRVGDRHVLVSPHLDRVAAQRGVECDLGPGLARRECRMDSPIVGRGLAALAAGSQEQR
jgi:hypothetical protein